MTTDLAVIEQEVAPEQKRAEDALALLRQVEIRNQEDLDKIASWTKYVKRRHKEVDERRTAITKPLLEAKRKADELFKPVLDALKAAEGVLRDKLGAYHLAQEKARVEAMRASAEVYQAGGFPTEIIPEPAQTQGVTMSSAWAFEITDPEAVPRGFCSPDDAKIRAAIPKDGEPYPIPGVRFFPSSKVIVRTK